MKKLTFCLLIALGACSMPQPERVTLEEPMITEGLIMQAPVPVRPTPCATEEVIARDGIGGTGCR